MINNIKNVEFCRKLEIPKLFYHLLKQMQQVERKYIVINKLIIDEKTVHFFYEYCYLSGDVL